MFVETHPNQQHVGLLLAVFQLQPEVTRPKARFKRYSFQPFGIIIIMQ